MSFYTAIPFEVAIKEYNRPRLSGAKCHKPDVISLYRTTVNQNLSSVRRKLRRFGSSLVQSPPDYINLLQSDASPAYTYALHGFQCIDVLCPTVFSVDS